jgi:type IV pilus assembly protein PilC
MSIPIPSNSDKAPNKSNKREKEESLWDFMNRDISLFEAKFSTKNKLVFYGQLETLLSAGLDIRAALEMIELSFNKTKDQQVVQYLLNQVVAGDSLSESMAKSKHFTIYEQYNIQIGEESGKLTTILQDLSDFFEKSIRYQRQLTGALAYPIFVLSFSVLAVLFLLRFLVPMFSGIYGRTGQDLPYLTDLVVHLSEWIGLLLPYFIGLISMIFVTLYWQRKSIWYKKMMGWVLLHIPLFGKIIQKIYLTRLCQAMALLLQAGVTLLHTIKLVRQMIDFHPISTSLSETEKQIFQGKDLHETLANYSFYPQQTIALIKVGEESGRLYLMFDRLAKRYSEEVDQQTAIIGALIEPILIVLLGGVVAIILVAMYLPLFKMSTSMGF